MIDEKVFINENYNPEIATPQELIEETIDNVEALLHKHVPDFIKFGPGRYTISRGSTQVMIIVRPFTKDETAVEFISNVVAGANITEDLMLFLLRKNSELHFGSFGLLFDNTIIFSHTLAGSYLDENELLASLNSVAVIADYYDDIIVDMAGGSRAIDIATF